MAHTTYVIGIDAGGTKTGFAFNATLSAKKMQAIEDKSIPLIFETPQRGMNLNMPYTKQDPSQAPKIFNSPRGWFTAPLQGKPKSTGAKGKVEINTK